MNKIFGDAAQVVFRRLPRFRGRWRIMRLLNRIYKSGLTEPVVQTRLKLGYRMKVDLRSRTEYETFYTGEYDYDLISSILNWFKAGWVVMDVGANVGFYSVPFAQKLKALGAGKVYCFEPVPANFSRLEENIRLNEVEKFAELHPVGLSCQKGEALITLREDFESGGETGNASILIEDGADSRFKTLSIKLKTLDGFMAENNISRLDYLKADIEGHEDMLFKGGWNSIKKFRPIIQAELNESYLGRKGKDIGAVLRQFRELDYEIRRLNSAKKMVAAELNAKRLPSEDLILIPKEKLD